MATTIQTIADALQLTFVGNSDVVVQDAMPLQIATASDITLVDSGRNVLTLRNSPAAAVVTAEQIENFDRPQIMADDPHQAFANVIRLLRGTNATRTVEIHPTAVIHSSVEIGADVSIGPNCVVDAGCRIGDRTVLEANVWLGQNSIVGADCHFLPNVSLYERTVCGHSVQLHAGVVLGSHGFGYRSESGTHQPTSQLGNVVIEDNCEIGSNTTIDRGTYGPTTIGQGTKIDNLVQIGHNCQIGSNNLICAQVGIAGSTATGSHVVLAGQVGVKDHIRLGDGVIAAAQSGISSSVRAGETVLGSPALPIKQAMRIVASQVKLPETRKQVRLLTQKLEELSKSIATTNEQSKGKSAA